MGVSGGDDLHSPLPPMRAALLGLLAVTSTAASLIGIGASTPAHAQQWGLLQPDGSIRNRYGLMMEGPNPGRMLRHRQTLPINRYSIDMGSGSIYRGGVLQSGPSPSRRMNICMQTGIC